MKIKIITLFFSILWFLFLAFFFSIPAFAGSSISISKNIVGEPFTITAVFNGLSNFRDKNGQMIPQDYQLKYAQLSIWNNATGRDTDYSQVTYEAYLNGNPIAGYTGLYTNWYPNSPFNYNSNDILTIKANNVLATKPGKYVADAFITVTTLGEHPLTSQLSVGSITPDNKSFVYTYDFSGREIPASIPSPKIIPTETPPPIVTKIQAHINTNSSVVPNKPLSIFNPQTILNYLVNWINQLFKHR